MRKLVLSTCLAVLPLFLVAQQNPTVAVVDFFLPSQNEIWKAHKPNRFQAYFGSSDYSKVRKIVNTVEGYAAEALVADKRFTVIERQQLNLVKGERELQKSEDFIDGYVVSQGQGIGADYILLGDFNPDEVSLILSIYSVADEKTVDKRIVDLKPVPNSTNSTRTQMIAAMQSMLFKIQPPKILLVRELDGNSRKVKAALISGGAKYGLREKQQLEVKISVMEEVDGQQLERLQSIAELLILKVEDDNFSQCEVVTGGDQLKNHLASGQKLYCYPKL